MKNINIADSVFILELDHNIETTDDLIDINNFGLIAKRVLVTGTIVRNSLIGNNLETVITYNLENGKKDVPENLLYTEEEINTMDPNDDFIELIPANKTNLIIGKVVFQFDPTTDNHRVSIKTCVGEPKTYKATLEVCGSVPFDKDCKFFLNNQGIIDKWCLL